MTNLIFVNSCKGENLYSRETQLLMLTRGLVNRGHRVVIVAARGSKLAREACQAGASVLETAFDPKELRQTLSDIGKAVESISTDTRRCVLSGTGYYTNLLIRFAKVPPNVKIVNIHHTLADAAAQEGKNLRARLWADKLGRKKIDGHVAVSHAVEKSLLAVDIPKDKITVIYNGIVPPKEEIPPRPKYGDIKRTVGFFGRLEPVKGPDLFLEAIVEIARRRPSMYFRIAGEGSMRASMEKQVEELGLAKKCKFVGYQNPYEFLPKIDVLIVPSRSEAFSTAAVEAQISRNYVVASDVGGIPEALCDPETSETFQVGDVEELVLKVCRIMGEQRRRRKMLPTVAEEAEKRFQPKVTVDGYMDFFQKLYE